MMAMDDPATALARLIGNRVRDARLDHHWTLDQLAEAAAVSRRAVVNVEQGSANPSIATLLRLADALGIGLPALVEAPSQAPLTVVGAGEGAVLWSGAAGGRGVLVAGTTPPDVVELWDWTLGPGDRHRTEPHAAGTRELMQVLEGQVRLEVGDQVITLGRGDAASFHGDVPHGYGNPGDDPARFVLAVHEPAVGATRPAALDGRRRD